MENNNTTKISRWIILIVISLAIVGLVWWRTANGPTEIECKIQGKILSTKMDGSAESFCAEKDYGGSDKVY